MATGNRLRIEIRAKSIESDPFGPEGAPAEGISAVKAIALASAEGQRIYTITRDNVEQALSNIILNPDTETEIRNAAYAGREITTHQYQLNFKGWIGEGYIIIDPQTGAGAYKIAGGGNGVWAKIKKVLNSLFGVLGIGAEVLDFILKDGPFGVIGNIISVLQAGLSVIDVFVSCSSVDVIIALIPIITLILFLSMFLGPLAFVIVSGLLRTIILGLAIWSAEQGTETLIDWHCN